MKKTKHIIIKNIENYGYRIGKSIRGKGLELFKADHLAIRLWINPSSPKSIEKAKKAVEKYEWEQLYVKDIWLYVEDEKKHFQFENAKIAQEHFNVKELLKGGFKGITEITINARFPERIGYFPISKYSADLKSQKRMIIELLSFDGKTLYGDELYEYYDELDYNDDIISFYSNGNDEYWNGDYRLIHGSETYCEDTEDCDYIDGRIYEYNELIIDDFWYFELNEDLRPYLDELDPNNEICVYTRKGKDWYVGYTYESNQIFVSYLNEDKEEAEEELYAYYFKENKTLLAKIVSTLETYRDNLKTRSFVYNEFGEEPKVANKDVIDFLYEDSNDLREEIISSISNWSPKTIEEEFATQYDSIIGKKVKVDNDLTVKVTYTPMQMVTKAKEQSVKRFNHLKILKRLEKRFGYELVHTSVFEDITTMAWALRKYGEEYHFDILSLIVDDLNGKITLKEFIVNSLNYLEKRKLEKISQAELFNKAASIFVGIEDSLQSGNCKYGTEQFIIKHHIDTKKIGGIRGDILLGMELSNFTKRAVNQAIMRHGRR